MTDLSLVIPLYNEALAFSVYGPRLLDAMTRRLRGTWEVILVVNGCTDDTLRVCRSLRARVVVLPENQGYGGGIIEGLRVATGTTVGYTSGDGQVSVEDVIRCIETPPPVKAWRRVRDDGWTRLLLSRVYNQIATLMLGLSIRDINAMPKFWTRTDAPVLESRDWFIDVELMLRLRHRPIREVGIVYAPRLAGRSRVRPATVLEFARNLSACKRDGRYERWTARS
jgi:glycosyltransferase involved in cell wall biosynthesis